jgi:hypothetical protein
VGALLAGLALALAAGVATAGDGHDRDPAVLERPAADLLWAATLRALHRQGLAVETAERAEGLITTAFVSVDAAAVPRVTLPDPRQPPAWGGAEYRLVISLGDRPERARIRVRAEIHARDGRSDPGEPGRTGMPLRSSRALEREFLDALGAALAALAGT